MLAAVGELLVYKVCHGLSFSEALQGSKGNWCGVDSSMIFWVKPCAILVYGHYSIRFQLGE